MAYTDHCINEAKPILSKYFSICYVHKDNILEYNPLYNATEFVTDLLSQAPHAVTNENQVVPLLKYSSYPFIALQVHNLFAGPGLYEVDAVDEADEEDENDDQEEQEQREEAYDAEVFGMIAAASPSYSVRRDAMDREVVCIDLEEDCSWSDEQRV